MIDFVIVVLLSDNPKERKLKDSLKEKNKQL